MTPEELMDAVHDVRQVEAYDLETAQWRPALPKQAGLAYPDGADRPQLLAVVVCGNGRDLQVTPEFVRPVEP